MMKESIKNYLGGSLVLLALVLAVSALVYVFSYRNALPAMNTFGVSGEGEVVMVPDVAKFSFSVITEGGLDIARLQTENSSKLNRAIAYLKDQGIKNEDIRTSSYNLSPRYQTCVRNASGTCPPPTIVGYNINQTVEVKVRDFDIVGDLLTGVVGSGANTVSRLSFTIDDPEEAKAEAREEAIAQAKEKAKVVARAGGFTMGRLVSIEEGDYYPVAYDREESFALGMGGDAMMSVPAPSIEPGSEEVKVTVYLRYEIK